MTQMLIRIQAQSKAENIKGPIMMGLVTWIYFMGMTNELNFHQI